MPRPKLERPNYRVERNRRTGHYELRWTDERRVSRTRSLRAEDLHDDEEARRWLDRFIAETERPPEPERKTVAVILDGYRLDREQAGVPTERIAFALKPLKRHLGWLTAEELKPSVSRRYAAARRREGVRDGTIRRELMGVLRPALSWAKDEGWIAAEPPVKAPSDAPPRDRWLSRGEADQLLAACIEPHARLFCILALHTAARTTAILELRWSAVDFESGLVALGAGTGNKGRATVPMNLTLRAALLEARELAQTDRVVEYRGGPVASVKKAVRAAARRAGLAGVTPHVLRATAATWMAKAGVPMPRIAQYLGHRDSRITERVYAKHQPEWLRDAAKALEG